LRDSFKIAERRKTFPGARQALAGDARLFERHVRARRVTAFAAQKEGLIAGVSRPFVAYPRALRRAALRQAIEVYR